jgi:predicted PurR-regulated permease PerM
VKIFPARKIFLLVVILLMGILITANLYDFVDGILGAVVLYVLYRPLMEYLVKEKKWKKAWTALLIILLTLVILIGPLIVFSNIVFPRLTAIVSDKSMLMDVVRGLDIKSQEMLGIKLISEENINNLKQSTTSLLTGFVGGTLQILADIGIMILILYFMLVNVGYLEIGFNRWLPFSEENIKKIGKELRDQTISNVLGSPVLALVQGIVAWIGYWIFGLPDPFFWGIVTGVFSFMPVVGSAMIWLPAALFLLSAGDIWPGIMMLIYGFFLISMSDNIFRFSFQKIFADVHPLVTVLGVIIGIKLFGLTGIIFGPLLISYFLILMKIYSEEYPGRIL